MKNWKVAYKIFSFSLALVALFGVAMTWVYTRMESSLYQGKQSEVRHTVESAWGVVDYYVNQERTGALSREAAQQAARKTLAHTRYDETNYFFVTDFSGRVVMHPIKPALNGKDLSGKQDPNGIYLFREFAEKGRQGAGFVEYAWPKPGSEAPVDKVSYVKGVPDWGWVVASGLYVDDIQEELWQIAWKVLLAGVLLVGVALILTGWLARGICRPLKAAVTMLDNLAAGRVGGRLNLEQQDEIGQMASTMDTFAASLEKDVIVPIQKLAEGDLTFTITPWGEDDQVRGALVKLEHQLNNLLQQVNASGEQIAAGSAEVASSSQTLAQAATQQASAVEQINSSITDLNGRTRETAGSAREARTLTQGVEKTAQEGAAHMSDLMGAMDEINTAGQNIGSIIKVIDEIAFQTNLLALNAAVEAARAGQHGKGFAVVAEEVRNLAARSAKAAQETAELIEGSIQKAQAGASIAGTTAGSLDEIVGGISQVTSLISEIADAAGEQAEGLGQIEVGLTQIDQSVQQNTAVSEESAAAAEELSSQAEQLRHLLSRFQLKQLGLALPTEARAADTLPSQHPWAA